MYLRTLSLVALLVGGFLSNSSQAQSLLERLEKQVGEATQGAKPATEEQVAPGFLGLSADDQNGILEVVSVRAGGPADQAGIKPGDRILSAGGVELKRLSDMAGVVGKLPAGSRVEFVLARDGRSVKITVVLAERAADPVNPTEPLPVPKNTLPTPAPTVEEPVEFEAGPAQLGVRTAEVSPELQRAYGLTVRRGAVIQSIVEGSPADRYGLPLGGAIVAVDGGRVDSPEDLAALIGAAEPGDNVEISYYVRDQVYRKRVRLAPTAVTVAPPAGAPVDRPFLRKLERAIDGAIAPAPAPLAPNNPAAQVQAMQAQIEELQARVADLEERLLNLERKKATPPPPAPQLPAPLKP